MYLVHLYYGISSPVYEARSLLESVLQKYCNEQSDLIRVNAVTRLRLIRQKKSAQRDFFFFKKTKAMLSRNRLLFSSRVVGQFRFAMIAQRPVFLSKRVEAIDTFLCDHIVIFTVALDVCKSS